MVMHLGGSFSQGLSRVFRSHLYKSPQFPPEIMRHNVVLNALIASSDLRIIVAKQC